MSVHPLIFLFDFDGVILNSRGSLLVMQEALQDPRYKWNEERKLEVKPIDLVRKFEHSSRKSNYQSIKAMYLAFQHLIPSRIQRWRFLGHVGRVVPRYENKFNSLIPYTTETLNELKLKGCLLGIISNSNRKRIDSWLTRTHLESLFSVIITRDDRKEFGVKPSAGPIYGALICLLRKFSWSHINRTCVAFVGDNSSDVRAAHQANVVSIAVLSGHGFKDELQTEHPDFIIPSIQSLPSHLHDIFPKIP